MAISINYLQTIKTEMMLNTYNVTGAVCFPTRIVNNSATLLENIFIDNTICYTIKLCINGLSDHDAQFIIFNNVPVPNKTPDFIYIIQETLITTLERNSNFYQVWNFGIIYLVIIMLILCVIIFTILI